MSEESSIKRCVDASIKREKPKENIRVLNEVTYAETMGRKPHIRRDMYKDIYESFQNNEV